MIRKKIAELIREAYKGCKDKGIFIYDADIEPIVEIPRESDFGDYSTNIAFILAPKLKKSPRDIANVLAEHIDSKGLCEKVDVAGKGFINFHIKDTVWRSGLKDLFEKGIDAFMPHIGEGRRVLIEFVSANPTGPLHIGHGRGAVVGDVLANILSSVKYDVLREYLKAEFYSLSYSIDDNELRKYSTDFGPVDQYIFNTNGVSQCFGYDMRFLDNAYKSYRERMKRMNIKMNPPPYPAK